MDEDVDDQKAPSSPSGNNGGNSKGVTSDAGNDSSGHAGTGKGARNVEDTTERRSLRSHDGGSRSKSELAMYFHNYEQMLSLEPKKPGMLLFHLPPVVYILLFSF